MSTTITLAVTAGKMKGSEYRFNRPGRSVIGRAPDCYPQLPSDLEHMTVSRRHCLLDIDPPRVRVRDVGSRNGTYVNGEKIGQRRAEWPDEVAGPIFPERELADGDEIRVGDTVFRVGIPADDGAAVPPGKARTEG
jgi:pSer/pThr/pTyr-binding forkhead associated (FHA) protein